MTLSGATIRVSASCRMLIWRLRKCVNVGEPDRPSDEQVISPIEGDR
jgi:hypothetical protein